MNEGHHVARNKSAMQAKRAALKATRSECAAKRERCVQHADCAALLELLDRLSVLIERYIEKLRRRMSSGLAQAQMEGRKKRMQVAPQRRNHHILVESEEDLLRDYALFCNLNWKRGLILLRVQNIQFVRALHGKTAVDSTVALLERQLLALCKEKAFAIRIYANKSGYVLLCYPDTHFLDFEAFCFALTSVKFAVPASWTPMPLAMSELDKVKAVAVELDAFDDRSPSLMIEGSKRKPCAKKQKSSKLSLVRSLSSLMRRGDENQNDDAASDVNDENCNVQNRLHCGDRECAQQLKTVFVSVCGAFAESAKHVEFYEKCELLRKEMEGRFAKRNENGACPLQLIEQLGPNDVVSVQKY